MARAACHAQIYTVFSGSVCLKNRPRPTARAIHQEAVFAMAPSSSHQWKQQRSPAKASQAKPNKPQLPWLAQMKQALNLGVGGARACTLALHTQDEGVWPHSHPSIGLSIHQTLVAGNQPPNMLVLSSHPHLRARAG